MNGPKHLWAGDWERESEAANQSQEPAPPRPAQTEQPVSAQPSASKPPPSRRRSPALPLLIVAALAFITGVAFGLDALIGGGSHGDTTSTVASAPPATTVPFPPANPNPGGAPQTVPQPTAPPTNTTPTSSSAGNGVVVYWDGMEIQTIAPDMVMIDTVRLGSLADQAGLEPGDQLTAVNGHQLNSATEIASAIKGLSAGKRITVQVLYGASTPQTVALTLGAPPSRYP